MIIELREHSGIREDGSKVVFAQKQVFIDGRRVGYQGLRPGDGLCLIRPLDAATTADVQAKIKQELKIDNNRVCTAPVLADGNESSSDDE